MLHDLDVTQLEVPEGPHFVYDQAPSLFLGRSGRGPLDVVWDTNVLVDYLTQGPAMWEGEPLNVEEEYGAQLEGLQLLIQLWEVREVRFRLFDRSIDDARRILEVERRQRRARAVDEFAAALRLSAYGDADDERDPDPQDPLPLWVPPTTRDAALEAVPEGADRELVRLALLGRAHVFLTRDKGVLRARDRLRPLGLLLATPLDLIEELAACGALLCVLRRETNYWPIPTCSDWPTSCRRSVAIETLAPQGGLDRPDSARSPRNEIETSEFDHPGGQKPSVRMSYSSPSSVASNSPIWRAILFDLRTLAWNLMPIRRSSPRGIALVY